MNGTVIPHTPIAVDFWRVRDNSQAKIFFLTHLHGDHITGLTSSWNFPIYCSEVTAKLLVETHGVRQELIHPLQIGCAELIYLDEARQETMTVTALDANHCPGAVMYLMEGYFGTILHTGDFRFTPDMLHDTCLRQFQGKIDTIYLDNTYCSPRCVFQSREEATETIIRIIEQHPDHDILLAMRNLGKEDLVCKIALHFQEWVYVPRKLYTTLEILGAPNVYDSTSTEHRIRVVPFQKMSNKFVAIANEKRPTIAIMPTSLYVGLQTKPYESNKDVHVVPYSDHSSFSEIRDFIAFLKPGQIVPVVASHKGPFGENISDRADMSVFKQYTRGTPQPLVSIPQSVQAFMSNRSVSYNVVANKGFKRKSSGSAKQVKRFCRGVTFQSPCKSVAKPENAENKTISDGKNKAPATVVRAKQALFSTESDNKARTCREKANETNTVSLGKQPKATGGTKAALEIIETAESEFDPIEMSSEENDKEEGIENLTDICTFRPLSPGDIEKAFFNKNKEEPLSKLSTDSDAKDDNVPVSHVQLNYGETQEFEPLSVTLNSGSFEEDGPDVSTFFVNCVDRSKSEENGTMTNGIENEHIGPGLCTQKCSIETDRDKASACGEDLLNRNGQSEGKAEGDFEVNDRMDRSGSPLNEEAQSEPIVLDESQPSQSLFSGVLPGTNTAEAGAATITSAAMSTLEAVTSTMLLAIATTPSATGTTLISAAATSLEAETMAPQVSAAGTTTTLVSAAGTTTTLVSAAGTTTTLVSAAGTTTTLVSAAGTTTTQVSAAETRTLVPAAGTTTTQVSAAETTTALVSEAGTTLAVAGTTTTQVSATETTTPTLVPAAGTTTTQVSATETTTPTLVPAAGTTTTQVSAAETTTALVSEAGTTLLVAGTTTTQVSAAETTTPALVSAAGTTTALVSAAETISSAAGTTTLVSAATKSSVAEITTTPVSAGTMFSVAETTTTLVSAATVLSEAGTTTVLASTGTSVRAVAAAKVLTKRMTGSDLANYLRGKEITPSILSSSSCMPVKNKIVAKCNESIAVQASKPQNDQLSIDHLNEVGDDMPVEELSSDSVQIIEPDSEPVIVIDCSEEPATRNTQLSYDGCMDLLEQPSQPVASNTSQQLGSQESTGSGQDCEQESFTTTSENCASNANSGILKTASSDSVTPFRDSIPVTMETRLGDQAVSPRPSVVASSKTCEKSPCSEARFLSTQCSISTVKSCSSPVNSCVIIEDSNVHTAKDVTGLDNSVGPHLGMVRVKTSLVYGESSCTSNVNGEKSVGSQVSVDSFKTAEEGEVLENIDQFGSYRCVEIEKEDYELKTTPCSTQDSFQTADDDKKDGDSVENDESDDDLCDLEENHSQFKDGNLLSVSCSAIPSARDTISNLLSNKSYNACNIEGQVSRDSHESTVVNENNANCSMFQRSNISTLSQKVNSGSASPKNIHNMTIVCPKIITPEIIRGNVLTTPHNSRLTQYLNDRVRTSSSLSDSSSLSACKGSVMHAFLRAYKQQETFRAIHGRGSHMGKVRRCVLDGRTVKKNTLS